MLSDSALLDEQTVQGLLQSGHSRVPVYRGDNRRAGARAQAPPAMHVLVRDCSWTARLRG